MYEKGENKMVKFELKNNGKTRRGSGFFLEIDQKFGLPFKKCLFTCNHVLDEEFMLNHDEIDLKLKNKNISINIDNNLEIYSINSYETNQNNKKKRKIFTESSFFDFTCIEIFDKEFKDAGFFKISKNYSNNNNEKDICVLHFPYGEDLSFSLGHIIKRKRNESLILHTASTVEGSSGSPVLLREDLSVIALHFGGFGNGNLSSNLEDILLNMKYTYLNIKAMKDIKNLLQKEFSIKFSCHKHIKKNQILINGKLGYIYAGVNITNNVKMIIVEINLIKYYKMHNSNFEEFSENIFKIIENIKEINNRKIYIYLECNCLNIIIGKYEEKFKQYCEKHDLSDNEINNILLQLNKQIKILRMLKIYPEIISPEKIILEEIKENSIKFKFLLYYDKIIQIDENNDLLEQSKDYGLFWSIGVLIYYLMMKYRFNLNECNEELKNLISKIPCENKTNVQLCFDILKEKLELNKNYKSLETLFELRVNSDFFYQKKN